jgi:regulator of protease activity HflC (stomatin/prohibitin superfamily)
MDLVPFAIGAVLVVATLAIVVQALLRVVTVYDYERGLEYASGRFVAVREAGLYLRLRPTNRIDRVDVRPMLIAVPGQEILTSDGVSLKASLVARYRVVDPKLAVNDTADHVGELYGALQLALREVIGGRPVEEVVASRAEIGARVTELAVSAATRVGVELLEADLKDIMFPGDLKRTFAQVVEARQEGLALLERARAETAALRSLANAARLVDERPSILQLRLLEQLSASSGNTIVLGAPGIVPMPSPPPTAQRTKATRDPG